MNTLLLKDKLTIVIPCKNEGVNIYECLGFISKQRGIAGTRVIISDNSDDEESLRWIYQTESDYKYSLKIEVIEGGFPAQARLNGSKLVTTPYMLFLDADIMLFKQGLLETVVEYEKDLVTVPFETETGFNWIFRMFDVTQRLSVFLGTPFAVGGFQLFKTETYWNIGGYNPNEKFAEDYSL
jgi:glycosyltransferase involved in cell wall biosynthesis